MKNWKILRIVLLAIALSGVILVLGKIVLYPFVPQKIATFELPDSVPLPEWQMLESTPLPIPENSEINAAKRYLYQKDRVALEVEMRYLVDREGKVAEFGKLEDWMKNYSGLDLPTAKLTVANTEGVGAYGFVQTQGRAYLSACINSQGGSTATADQFMKNRNKYDLQLKRILPWLLGQGELRDRRCLWTQMSIPLDKEKPEKAYQTLETVWVSWYSWWQPRFPKL